MTAIALARILLLAACFASCAGGPGLSRSVTIVEGQPTRVTLMQVKEQRTFLLQNASSTAAEAFYADWQKHPLGKVVPDDRLQTLLDVFAERGLFETGSGGVPLNARDVLRVEHGGRTWTWARVHAGVQQEEAVVHEARAYFLEVYNSSMAYRPSDPKDRPDLTAEQLRARDEAEAAKRRLERLQGSKP